MPFSWFRTKGADSRPARKARPAAAKKPRYHTCHLELLEDRLTPSQYSYLVNVAGDTGVNTSIPGQASGDIRYCITQADQPVLPGSTITITFAADVVGTTTPLTNITLTQGELQINQSMTITGPGAANLTISGGAGATQSRIFDITSQTATVVISGLTITNGNGKPAPNDSGNQGGDIFNSGILTLSNDVVSNGLAAGAASGPEGRGGGIFNAGGTTGATLVVDHTTITGNTAQGQNNFGGAGGIGAGGGIYSDAGASLTLQNGSQITNNKALGGNGGSGGSGASGASGGSTGAVRATGANGHHGQPGGKGAPGGRGHRGQAGKAGSAGGAAFGAGVYNAGALTINGTLAQVVFSGQPWPGAATEGPAAKVDWAARAPTAKRAAPAARAPASAASAASAAAAGPAAAAAAAGPAATAERRAARRVEAFT